MGERIAIYGWSIGDHDLHILKALKMSKKRVKAIAVSVNTQNIPWTNVEEKCKRLTQQIEKIFGCGKLQILFFHASSDGCWTNPASAGESFYSASPYSSPTPPINCIAPLNLPF